MPIEELRHEGNALLVEERVAAVRCAVHDDELRGHAGRLVGSLELV